MCTWRRQGWHEGGAGKGAVSEERKLRSTRERFSGRSGNLARHYSWQCFYQSRDNIRRVLSRGSKEESLLLSSTLTCSSLGRFLFPVSRASSSCLGLNFVRFALVEKPCHTGYILVVIGCLSLSYALSIDDMRSVTESRNKGRERQLKRKMATMARSVGRWSAFVKNQNAMRWIRRHCGAKGEWFYHDLCVKWVNATIMILWLSVWLSKLR